MSLADSQRSYNPLALPRAPQPTYVLHPVPALTPSHPVFIITEPFVSVCNYAF